MGQNRLTVFDTTLRDGEQAPGFSMRIHEKVRLAKQLDALGVDVIEAGFPIASEADAEAVKAVAAAVRRPVIAGLARACAGDIDRAGAALRGGGAVAHPHLHRHVRPAPRAQAEHDARGLPRRRDRGRGAGAPLYRRRAVLGGGRDAQRHRLPVPRRRGRHRRRGHHDQPAGHGRLLDAGRDRRVLHRRHRAGAQRRQGRVQRALPQRPGPGRGELARRHRRGRAPGGVHDQRHRRARRQRVARRGGDGASASGRTATRTRPASTRRALYADQPAADAS